VPTAHGYGRSSQHSTHKAGKDYDMARRIGRKPYELKGKRFGRLTALQRVPRGTSKKMVWACLCDCGKSVLVVTESLVSGGTKSCGCLHIERIRERCTTHGKSATKEYRTWWKMISRCVDRNNADYNDYGGRGIVVCQRWRESFEAFIEDMGLPPPGTSIDRIDNDGPYSPENCRWATAKEQANNKRNNLFFACSGETLSLAQWAEKTGQSLEGLYQRIYRGWNIQDAIFTPRDDSHDTEKRRVFVYKDRPHTISQLVQISGHNRYVLYRRLVTWRWDVERAITQPNKRKVCNGLQ
jgi:hypothetical protein